MLLKLLSIFVILQVVQPQTLIEILSRMNNRLSYQNYLMQRQQIINDESQDNFASDVILSQKEKKANKIIMNAKTNEINAGFTNPAEFSPALHFFKALDQINANSTLLRILKKMPKGGVLHSHDTALASTDYVMQLTYRENLWQCNDDTTGAITSFRFSLSDPSSNPSQSNLGCTWVKVSEQRASIGQDEYDSQIRPLFTLYVDDPQTAYPDINTVWNKFGSIFGILNGILLFAPVWKEYYKESLREMYADGVQYLEFRSVVPQLYNYTEDTLPVLYTVQLYVEGLNEYMEENPYFIGSKMIYAPVRQVTDETFDGYLDTLQDLIDTYPNFVKGFDLVGQEDLGRPLIDYAEKLNALPDNIKFYFHAGETNWYGLSTDRNLIDAILLGTKRIGHGFALVKHPEILKIMKQRDIPVEVNPISNQVLKLVEDMRNHPAAVFFANNIPMVISSDDPSLWEALPLSHDFYEAFLGIVSAESDLRTLKKWTFNSIKYSALNNREKAVAYSKLQYKWNQFIQLFQ